MDLRNLPLDMDAHDRVNERRTRIERELGINLGYLSIEARQIGAADEKNCEQMFGAVPVPVGLAGPLRIHFGSEETRDVFLPLATTEGALVASVNRGCKALTEAGGVYVSSEYVGITRSIAFEVNRKKGLSGKIRALTSEWKKIAQSSSRHLKILSFDIDMKRGVLFLTIAADTDEAMGMNMITIAAQEVGEFLSKKLHIPMLTVAGNVDSDKKPSTLTKRRGRGYRVKVESSVPEKIIQNVLKSDSYALFKTARAKLKIGSALAGALGKNLQVANIVSTLYLATGQDVAHVVESSLADTSLKKNSRGIQISVEIPALLLGVRGGGTDLPAQKQCLELLLKEKTKLRPTAQLAEIVGGAILAGELSLLAAQATNTLADAHRALARGKR